MEIHLIIPSVASDAFSLGGAVSFPWEGSAFPKEEWRRELSMVDRALRARC
jgi:hypothetical protein